MNAKTMINAAGKPSKKANLSYTWLKSTVLDNSLAPAGYDRWGRFAFLDALARSYPGFIITGDEV
ncbi:MAG: hypothetical protein ACXV4C_11020 [Halobacteriota archaeon]